MRKTGISEKPIHQRETVYKITPNGTIKRHRVRKKIVDKPEVCE